MWGLKFTESGPVSGDCTAPYEVEWRTDGRRSVSAFVAVVLRDRSDQWGRIYLIDGDGGWMHAPFVEYRSGSVIRVSASFLGWDDDREIDSITARGGWGNMDYYVRFRKTEPAKDEGEEGSKGKMGVNDEIVNAKITNVTLSMADHGSLVYGLTLDMGGSGCVYGGVVIGKGYLGAKAFEGYEKGTEALMRIMDVVGVERWEDLTGKYVRIEVAGRMVDRIGNIIEDKWFSQKEFFGEGRQNR